jgi:hypothetical protein
MPSHSSRKFAILDAMIAVAAVSVGIALVRATAPTIDTIWRPPYVTYVPGTRNITVVYGLLSYVLPFLAAWTPALLFLRLRQPRPRLRYVFRQPGTVACVAATLAMSIELFFVVPLLAFSSRFWEVESLFFVGYSPEVSFAIIGSWSALALTGRARTEPGWIDLAGRITGAAWLACTAVSWASLVFP